MNKKFTKLIAALALLVFMTPSLAGWGQTTETLNIGTYASTNNWENGINYTSAEVGNVTFSASEGTNTGKYYTTDDSWRFYSNEGATLTISVPSGSTLSSITPTFTTKDYGTLVYGSSNCTSGTAVSVSGNSAVFAISQSSGSKGKVFFTEISVTYTTDGGNTPSITISEGDLQLPYTENENGNFTVSYSNFEPAAATAMLYSNQACTQAFPTTGDDAWILLYDDDLEEPYTSILYMVTTNESITDRTAYLKVEAMDGDLNEIDEVFTITQAGMPTYTVTYNANGAESGEVPTDATQYTPLNNSVTVKGNVGSPVLAKTGYSLSGWCLNAEGTGTVYGPGDNQTPTYTISANTTFYAHWTINSYNVTLPAEDDYGTYTMNKTNPVTYGTEVTLTYTPKPDYENFVATWRVNGTALVSNKFNMPDAAVTVTIELVEYPFVTSSLQSSNMQNMKDENGNAIAYTGQNTTNGYGVSKFVTTSDGFTWMTTGFQTGSNNTLYGMIQLKKRDGANYIKLPEFPGKIENIVLKVTDATSNNYNNGSNCTAILAFQADKTSSEDVIDSGGSTDGTKEITLDLTGKFYSTGYITVTNNKSARIWNIDVTYRPYKNLNGTTISTIDADRAIAIPADAIVTATEGLTIPASSGIIIKSGASLTVTGTLTNNGTVANLVIENGGQLHTTSANVAATVKKSITGYGESNTVKTGWNFIASPINVNELAPTNVTNMLSNNYDLYRLDPSTNYWQNYKEHDGNIAAGFSLANSRGYLYANSNNVTLSFAGTIKPYISSGENANNEVSLSAGWNLVGNPFTFNVFTNKSYYKITTTTIDDVEQNVITAVTNPSDAITPCTGIVLYSAEASTVTFNDNAGEWSTGNKGNIQMALAQNSVVSRDGASTISIIDNAIVSFNEGTELEKFYFGNNAANIFIPQNNEEFAIVSAQAQGEMPVNFVAAEAGEYTITVNAEDVEMSYLHLIDNIAGQDIDLIATPSYTFNAQPTDYASRFRLVFSANNVNDITLDGEDFAFVGSDGQLIINGTGTVQIIDMMGRVISTRSTDERISTNGMTTGVYVLQLINGSETKTQKIMVK